MRLFSQKGADFEKVWLQCFIFQKQVGNPTSTTSQLKTCDR
jgi:hypothetical protein